MMSTSEPDITPDHAVLQSFAETVGTQAPRGVETTPADIAAWDSLAQVHLVAAIETRLSVTLPDEALTTRTTLGDLVAQAHQALGSRSAAR
ncbi:acyl carrier protein [Streptomyces sp. NPDC091371]|uniref:acyl carrier protein n=1 Tax=Streptomyces sp. NPDC091371 TaxID=3155303 RepID=UPI003442B8FF